MKKAGIFDFTVDREQSEIRVERVFDADKALVWRAWTESSILDQWWAPKPWRTRTRYMDFREGGYWLYAMLGPAGEEHWSRTEYTRILAEDLFAGKDGFCDSEGNIDPSLPQTLWECRFLEENGQTRVQVHMRFQQLSDLETTLQMGFREGFTSCLENLEHYIQAQFYLRSLDSGKGKTSVSTYLNFDGNTEEAFLFYREVFGTEFTNGIQHFGDLPPDPANPPIPEEIKRMVLHVELPILGGHCLKGTDAPKEMGFSLVKGNNTHIHLETESKEEADRLFAALSVDGIVEMPMADMFFGSYFGAFQDRYGINWMVNYREG